MIVDADTDLQEVGGTPGDADNVDPVVLGRDVLATPCDHVRMALVNN